MVVETAPQITFESPHLSFFEIFDEEVTLPRARAIVKTTLTKILALDEDEYTLVWGYEGFNCERYEAGGYVMPLFPLKGRRLGLGFYFRAPIRVRFGIAFIDMKHAKLTLYQKILEEE